MSLTKSAALVLALALGATALVSGSAHAERNPSDLTFNQFVRGLGGPDGNGRFVLVRSYLPASQNFDDVSLPDIIVRENGSRTVLPECPWRVTQDRDHFAAELAAASSNYDIRRIVRIIAAIIGIRPIVPPAPYCSWWFVVNNSTFNIAFPDSHASYWATPFIASEDTEYILRGEYGNMRYYSLAIYDQQFNYYQYAPRDGTCDLGNEDKCFGSYITDFQIDPIVPLTNPFRTRGPQAKPDSRFRVRITATPEDYLDNGATTGCFTGEECTGANVLPALLTESGCLPGQCCNAGRRPPPQCEDEGTERVGRDNNSGSNVFLSQNLFPPPCNFPAAPYTCATPNVFARPTKVIVSSVVSNPDNTYIPAGFDGREQILPLDLQDGPPVFVLRGQIPTTPYRAGRAQGVPDSEIGRIPVPWNPTGRFDMRYWSICTALYIPPYPTVESTVEGLTQPDNSCVADLELHRTNEAGRPRTNGNWFTVVLSTLEGRPARRPNGRRVYEFARFGSNWLELSARARNAVILRNMLPNLNFDQAAQNIPASGNWKDALETMEDYFPLSLTACTKEHFEEHGWGGCVAPRVTRTSRRLTDGGPGTGFGL
ncbi:MAG: hypothetical protein AAF500_14920 [Myxococcota bacterium]